LYQGIVER